MKHAPPVGAGGYDTLCGVDLDDPIDESQSPAERGEAVAVIGGRVTCPHCIEVIKLVQSSFPSSTVRKT